MFGSQGNSGLMTRYAVNTGSLGRESAGSLRTKISELTTAQSVKCPTVLLVLPVERLCPQKNCDYAVSFQKIYVQLYNFKKFYGQAK